MKEIKQFFCIHKYGKFGESHTVFFLSCHKCNKFIDVDKRDIKKYKLHGTIKRPQKLSIKFKDLLKKHKLYFKFRLYKYF